MTQVQGTVLILLVAFAVGWYVGGDLTSRPDTATRALEAHERLMGRGD